MSYLYVNESSAKISVQNNYIVVEYKNGLVRKLPIETLETIQIFGQAQMTSQCTVQCIKKGIMVVYYSKGGSYFGRLESTGHVNVERQRKQCQLYQSEFSLNLSKKIIKAKIHNQLVVLKRYGRSVGNNLEEETKMIKIFENKITDADTIEQIMGYEGNAARYYFQGLSKVVNDDFKFSGRNRRPPKDPFNSMLSLGYSILMNEIYGKIVSKGLNPYFGFMHSDKEKHPTLASDLMEEWRAVLIDSLVMSLINGNEIKKEHFISNIDNPGVYLTEEGMKIYIKKYDKKVRTEAKYLENLISPVSFRHAIDIQISSLVNAIMNEDCELYNPIKIR